MEAIQGTVADMAASYAARMEQLSAHADDSWNPNHMLKY